MTPSQQRTNPPASAPTGWWPTLKRTALSFRGNDLGDRAAALTYYGLLALFPALIAFVAIVGLVGDPTTTTRTLTDIVANLGPRSAADTFAGPIRTITSSKGTAGIMAVVGFLVALWSASSYVGAFTRAANVIYEKPEGRPFWKLRPLQLLVTLVMLLALVVIAFALVLTGPVASAVAGPLGIGGTAVSLWDIAKWPVLVLVVVAMFSVLFYATPNVRLRSVWSVAPGSLAALAIWIVASVGFAIYAANFSSYDKTYGSLGGAVVFLVWIWITNSALLFGMTLNAERERDAELREGLTTAARELQLDPRARPETAGAT